ncbi:CD209 antigen-like protein C isoform 2-T2 [Pholidichthys leucotaenia]
MEEELTYTAVIFQTAAESTYDNNKKLPLIWVLVVLAVVCLLLVSVIIGLSLHFTRLVYEQRREIMNLTSMKISSERRSEELSRDRDQLNWTIGVILDYETFPVQTHCPQKVCKPCLEAWVQFESSCYWFSDSKYFSGWKTWEKSNDDCREMNAHLVVVESQEEQKFISNHTHFYKDEKHGYWIGLKKDMESWWKWVDGNNLTVTYWKTESQGYAESCALNQPRVPPLANWKKEGCSMRNRWICETRALIKPEK